MYVLQRTPDETAMLDNGESITPVATLKDEHGGVLHIIVDDHCYVLTVGSRKASFRMTSWWNAEAVEALRQLPLPQ